MIALDEEDSEYLEEHKYLTYLAVREEPCLVIVNIVQYLLNVSD